MIDHLEGLKKSPDHYGRLKELIHLPGYMQVAKAYEDLAGELAITGDAHKDLDLKFSYLLKIVRVKGLAAIHENIIREMNRTCSALIKIEEPEQLKPVISEFFSVLGSGFSRYPDTILHSIQMIGNELYRKGQSGLVDWYLQKIVSLGFQYPEIKGVTDEWQVKSNLAHLKNIRVWMELIENEPKWSKSLISALIIQLRLCGVYISDTDIFQKDVTRLLNSDITPVYHMVKQLARIFPVYFSDIGAEGPLREVSTEIDESTHRADVLVHFLRKQSHVESSARVVDFIEAVISFWRTKDKNTLKEFLPEDIYERLKTSGPYIDDLHSVFSVLFSGGTVSRGNRSPPADRRRVTELYPEHTGYLRERTKAGIPCDQVLSVPLQKI